VSGVYIDVSGIDGAQIVAGASTTAEEQAKARNDGYRCY
jgi:hypothetical protein